MATEPDVSRTNRDVEALKNFYEVLRYAQSNLVKLYQTKAATFNELEEWYLSGRKENVAEKIRRLGALLKLEDKYFRSVEQRAREVIGTIKDFNKAMDETKDRKAKVYLAATQDFCNTFKEIINEYLAMLSIMDNRRRKEERFLNSAAENPEKVIHFYKKFLEQLRKESHVLGAADTFKHLNFKLKENEMKMKVAATELIVPQWRDRAALFATAAVITSGFIVGGWIPMTVGFLGFVATKKLAAQHGIALYSM